MGDVSNIVHAAVLFGDPATQPNALTGLSGVSLEEKTSLPVPAVQGHNINAARGFIAGQNPFAAQTVGVFGESPDLGVVGIAGKAEGVGVYGGSQGGKGIGVMGEASGGGLAAKFKGDVEVSGDIRLINQDCAEDFDIVNLKDAEPGTVMVLDQSGALECSSKAYDKRVAGVISGAGDCKPGIILGKQKSESRRMPIALLGKVYCKVDAQYSPIEVGDLLTTSLTPGHAMKAEDPQKAFGSVIGKAMRPLTAGRGLVPVLVALQ
jgi:hypothetical protein